MSNKAVEMGRVSARGSFNLFWGVAASNIITAVGVVLVALLLTDAEYGSVTLALVAPSLFIILRDWGVNPAIVKFTAQYREEGKIGSIRSMILNGLLLKLVTGSLLTLACFLLSGFVATNLYNRPEVAPLMQVASFIVLGGGFLTVAQAAFTGFERLELSSFTMVFQAVLRTTLGPVLVFAGFGAFGAILGYTLAFLGGGLISMLILYLTIYRKSLRRRNITQEDYPKTMETIRTIFKFGVPLSISTILLGSRTQYLRLLMGVHVQDDDLIGSYKVSLDFGILMTLFALPLRTVLLPAFSKLSLKKDQETLRNVFRFSVKYAALIVVPATVALMTLSQPAVSTIFGQRYSTAPIYLSLGVTIYLHSAIGHLILKPLLNSQGKTKISMIMTLLSTVIGYVLAWFIIPIFGIIGVILATVLSFAPGLIYGLWWVRKNFQFTLDWIASLKILLAAGLAGVASYLLITLLNNAAWIELTAGTLTLLTVYVLALALLRAVNETEIENLREVLQGLGPLTRLLDLLLKAFEKILSII